MATWKIIPASILIALVYEFTVLLFTANADKFIKWKTSPARTAAFASFIINLFFWQAWDGRTAGREDSPLEGGQGGVLSQDILFYIIIFLKVFASWLLSWLNYTYSDLFVKLWKENQLSANNEDLATRNSKLATKNQELTTRNRELKTDVKDRITRLDYLTCPHCLRAFEKIHGLNGHIGKCPERDA